MASGEVDQLRIDTRVVDRRERYEWWQHHLSNSMYPVVIAPAGPTLPAFDARFDAAHLGNGTSVSRGVLDPVASTITAGAARQSPNDVVQFTISGRHNRQLLVRDEWVDIPAGALVVHDATVACVHRANERDTLTMVTVPRAALTIPTRALQDLALRALPIDSASRRVLRHAAADVLDPNAQFPAAAAQPFLAGAADLVLRAIIGRDPDHAGTTDVRRQQVLDYLSQRLGDPGLVLSDIAAELTISTRRLQQLFEDQGGLAATLRGMRIDRARALLADPANSHLSIERIGMRSGFRDRSAFSRAYLAVTGHRPSDDRPNHTRHSDDPGHPVRP